MSGINKVILIGNMGKDPEMRSFQSGERVANFSVATSKKWKDKVNHEEKQNTEWHNIVAFGKLAEICDQYLHKGDKVYIEGYLKTDKYTGKDGVERYTTKIIAEQLQMLGAKGEREEGPTPSLQPVDHKSFDDDIPF